MRTLLLRLVHYVISIGEFLYNLISWLPAQGLASKAKSLQKMQADSKILKRLPVHVGILIAEDEYHFKDLANLIVWSVTLGISYITVYDINGEVKRNSLLLQRHIDASKDELMGCEKSVYDIQICSPVDLSSRTPLVESVSSKPHRASVHLLCAEDGCERIASMARYLSQMVHAGMYKTENIKPGNVDRFFSEVMQFPDPDLCLKFGSVNSLCGYLPWQIRLTEFISFPSHRDIKYKSFLSSLFQFSKINQRFGT